MNLSSTRRCAANGIAIILRYVKDPGTYFVELAFYLTIFLLFFAPALTSAQRGCLPLGEQFLEWEHAHFVSMRWA